MVINGGGNIISFTGDSSGGQDNYVIQVYNTEGVTICDLNLTGGDAGLLVKGATVTLEGNIDVSGNEFGGIKVVKSDGVEANPLLTVSNTALTNTTEAYGLPTIWEDSNSGNVRGFNGTRITYHSEEKNQEHYYIEELNSKSNVTNIKAKNNMDIIQDVDNIDYTLKIKNGVLIGRLKYLITSTDGSLQKYLITDSEGTEVDKELNGYPIRPHLLLEVIAGAGNKQVYNFIIT